jgi:hypothetical protein
MLSGPQAVTAIRSLLSAASTNEVITFEIFGRPDWMESDRCKEPSLCSGCFSKSYWAEFDDEMIDDEATFSDTDELRVE